MKINTYEAMRSLFDLLRKSGSGWDESKHPRAPAGSPNGGQFVSEGGELDESRQFVMDGPYSKEEHAKRRIEQMVALGHNRKELGWARSGGGIYVVGDKQAVTGNWIYRIPGVVRIK